MLSGQHFLIRLTFRVALRHMAPQAARLVEHLSTIFTGVFRSISFLSENGSHLRGHLLDEEAYLMLYLLQAFWEVLISFFEHPKELWCVWGGLLSDFFDHQLQILLDINSYVSYKLIIDWLLVILYHIKLYTLIKWMAAKMGCCDCSEPLFFATTLSNPSSLNYSYWGFEPPWMAGF